MSVILRFGHDARHGAAPLDSRIRQAVRRCIEDEVVRLIDMLDGLDVDPDLEPTGDEEPSLWFASMTGFLDDNAPTDDREEDAGDEGEPDFDGEPTLGWTSEIDQERFHSRQGSYLYGEDEPDVDAETESWGL